MGAVICEKSGVVNLGLEGIMLSSALAGVMGSAFSGSLFVGVLTGMAMGLALSAVFAYFHLVLKANAVLCGTAINTFAGGFTVFMLEVTTGEKGNSSSLKSLAFGSWDIPVLKDIPFIGDLLSGHNVLTYMAFLMVGIIWYLLYKTPLGLRIRAVGENEDAINSVGISVKRVRFIAIMICGVMASFGGMYLSMGYLNMFVRDMVAGRGFISLAANAMGQATPIGTMLSALVFAFFDGLSNILQLLKIPSEFVQMLPYAATIAGLVAYSIQKTHSTRKKHGLVRV
jgi:simple sugar transport system permease protein